jgi:CHAD domain-containing protein
MGEPAQRVAREIARERVAGVRVAYAGFGQGDADALHDLRVALRRLRSWLRAFDPVLDDTLRRRTLRALSKVARATNAARDAQVAVDWVAAQRRLLPRARGGCAAFLRRITEDRDRATREVIEQLATRLPAALDELEAQLSHYWRLESLDRTRDEAPMGVVTSELVTRHNERLRRSLLRVRTMADVAAAHRTRIAGKRLRYLLEQFAHDPHIARVLDRLKALQDHLGEFHDAHLLEGRIARELRDVASSPTLAPGLLELAERARARERESFGKFRRSWNVRGARAVFEAVRAIAADLRSEATKPGSPDRSAP